MPVGAVVDLTVVATDVIHSWWIPALGGKIQAIPGRINHTWFQARSPARTTASAPSSAASTTPRCCGTVVAESQAAYDAYLATLAPTIGKQDWSGVCATCHGNLGQGGYGPNIATNSLLVQAGALARILRNGFVGSAGAMPPVGDTWTPAQIERARRVREEEHLQGRAAAGGTTSGG